MCTVLQKPPESFLVTAVRALFLRGDSEHIQIGFPVGGVPFQLVSSHLCSQCAVPAWRAPKMALISCCASPIKHTRLHSLRNVLFQEVCCLYSDTYHTKKLKPMKNNEGSFIKKTVCLWQWKHSVHSSNVVDTVDQLVYWKLIYWFRQKSLLPPKINAVNSCTKNCLCCKEEHLVVWGEEVPASYFMLKMAQCWPVHFNSGNHCAPFSLTM